MRKENKRTGKKIDSLKNSVLNLKPILNFKIEEDYHRSPAQRIIHIICFILPVAMAFLGVLIASPIWHLFSKEQTPELFKFIVSIILFVIPIIIIFVKTRNTNPIMNIRIRVSDNKSKED